MSNWIDISKRKPKEGQMVVVCGVANGENAVFKDPLKTAGVVIWSNNGKPEMTVSDVGHCAYEMYFTDATHWMPIPKLPIES